MAASSHLKQRYVAVKVSSDRGPNVYRLVGPASADDAEIKHSRYGWPEQVIVLFEEKDYVPVFQLSISTLAPNRYLTNVFGISVEVPEELL